ncbi:(R,S)-reticuline 7-O-methyltransferase [Hibiscus syriacus]|uniref:(R,S)-reticuline 7-O-methyltransferase n=1 Tax=Hibiscus syriacus TaxID=106335 RepID=A0A6A2WFL7_HIBSY|nr:(R,S)-reticuline 7-O-methyltransferase [Hibiscus syriacus]
MSSLEKERQMATTELEEATLQGQAEIWRFMFSYVDSMALKSAIELRIADIIHSHGGAITLSQIASCINGGSSTSSPDINTLSRIMRLLVRRKIFTIHHPSDGGDPVYDLTHSSRWLLHDSEQTLAPMILMENHPLLLAPWHCLSQCVQEGGVAFKKAHGREVWDLASENPEFNRLFNDGMTCTSKVITRAILSGYKERLSSIGSLVDVGGGTGSLTSEIVKAYPHIKGVNFDLQHVVSAAPPYDGVCHIAGNMFHAIPNADAVIMKVRTSVFLRLWRGEEYFSNRCRGFGHFVFIVIELIADAIASVANSLNQTKSVNAWGVHFSLKLLRNIRLSWVAVSWLPTPSVVTLSFPASVSSTLSLTKTQSDFLPYLSDNFIYILLSPVKDSSIPLLPKYDKQMHSALPSTNWREESYLLDWPLPKRLHAPKLQSYSATGTALRFPSTRSTSNTRITDDLRIPSHQTKNI